MRRHLSAQWPHHEVEEAGHGGVRPRGPQRRAQEAAADGGARERGEELRRRAQ